MIPQGLTPRSLSRGVPSPTIGLPFRKWSGWRDSNPRPSAPKAATLTRLSYIQMKVNYVGRNPQIQPRTVTVNGGS